MAKCVTASGGYIVSTQNYCDYVLITPEEFEALQLQVEQSNLVFDIDSEFYAEITGYLLLSFVTGHVLGRIVKGLSRA